MITTVQSLSVGNALRLFLTPPKGATSWRVFRAGSDAFEGPEQTETSFMVYEGDDKAFVDAAHLPNEIMAFYKPYYRIGDEWVEGAAAYGTPVATYEELSTDTLTILRDRLEAGLKVEVERGNLNSGIGYVQVFTAPPQLDNNIRFPLVTLSLDSDAPAERGIGDSLYGDEFDEISGDWIETSGWLAADSITLIGWSQNPEERLELRKAIRRVIVANLPVFDNLGLQQVSISFTDMDAVSGEAGAVNVYQTLGTFTCQAPVIIGNRATAIKDIEVTNTNG